MQAAGKPISRRGLFVGGVVAAVPLDFAPAIWFGTSSSVRFLLLACVRADSSWYIQPDIQSKCGWSRCKSSHLSSACVRRCFFNIIALREQVVQQALKPALPPSPRWLHVL